MVWPALFEGNRPLLERTFEGQTRGRQTETT